MKYLDQDHTIAKVSTVWGIGPRVKVSSMENKGCLEVNQFFSSLEQHFTNYTVGYEWLEGTLHILTLFWTQYILANKYAYNTK